MQRRSHRAERCADLPIGGKRSEDRPQDVKIGDSPVGEAY